MPSDCAFVIESGSVEVSKSDPDGGRKILAILKENDIFGEMGLIDGLPRSCTIVALEPCNITKLSKEAFDSLADRNPQALMPILKILAQRLRSTLKLVEELESKDRSTTAH